MAEPDYDLVRTQLSAARQRRSLNLREAAREIGVSAPTLSRIERGASKPDPATLEALVAWLGIDRGLVYNVRQPEPRSTVAAVEVALRSDTSLDATSIDALMRIFRAAYAEFASEKLQRRAR